MENPQVTHIDEDNLRLENLPDGRNDRLLRKVRVITRLGHQNHRTFEIPVGFETDWASVPTLMMFVVTFLLGFRFDWTGIPFILACLAIYFIRSRGRHNKADLFHDYLYREQPDGITRRQADYLYLDFQRFTNEIWIIRIVMFCGVRLGGWLPWKRNAAKKAKREG